MQTSLNTSCLSSVTLACMNVLRSLRLDPVRYWLGQCLEALSCVCLAMSSSKFTLTTRLKILTDAMLLSSAL